MSAKRKVVTEKRWAILLANGKLAMNADGLPWLYRIRDDAAEGIEPGEGESPVRITITYERKAQ